MPWAVILSFAGATRAGNALLEGTCLRLERHLPETGAGTEHRITRRELLLTAGGAALAVAVGACSHRQPGTTSAAPGSIDALTEGAGQLSVIGSTTPVKQGPQSFAFFLVAGQSVLPAAQPSVWFAKDTAARATGPVEATWYPMDGYSVTKDTSPQSPLTVGVYVAEVDLDSTGIWTIAATVTANGRTLAGTSSLPVSDAQVPAEIGTKAHSVSTPVATTRHGLEEICTRRPPDQMHYISLDDALRNGKPTVVSFATPLLCESQMCGPVVDEQLVVFTKYGPDKANFIHVEEFLPGKDLKPPPATAENLSPAFKAWGFEDEPWVIVIDRKGVIRGRLGPGATAAGEIDAVLEPLL